MRPAFSRQATHVWFVIVFVGFLVRNDTLGVNSIIRALSIAPESYNCLLHFFHSTAWSVERLMALSGKRGQSLEINNWILLTDSLRYVVK